MFLIFIMADMGIPSLYQYANVITYKTLYKYASPLFKKQSRFDRSPLQ